MGFLDATGSSSAAAVSIREGPWLQVFRQPAPACRTRPVTCCLSSWFAAPRCSSERASPLLQRLYPLLGRDPFLVAADAPSSFSLSHRAIKPFQGVSAPLRWTSVFRSASHGRLSFGARPRPTLPARLRRGARTRSVTLWSPDPQQPPCNPPVEQRRPRDHTRPAHPHQHVGRPLLRY
jgi:hypothetical protein